MAMMRSLLLLVRLILNHFLMTVGLVDQPTARYGVNTRQKLASYIYFLFSLNTLSVQIQNAS